MQQFFDQEISVGDLRKLQQFHMLMSTDSGEINELSIKGLKTFTDSEWNTTISLLKDSISEQYVSFLQSSSAVREQYLIIWGKYLDVPYFDRMYEFLSTVQSTICIGGSRYFLLKLLINPFTLPNNLKSALLSLPFLASYNESTPDNKLLIALFDSLFVFNLKQAHESAKQIKKILVLDTYTYNMDDIMNLSLLKDDYAFCVGTIWNISTDIILKDSPFNMYLQKQTEKKATS
ncbi:hypothetical protein KKH43_04420 [Patescibacteria group bacterium]|nr:hypothetical protein [Patescibacteria group bacterium]